MNLIENWKSCLGLFSVQANSVGIAMSATYGLMFDQLKDTLPPKWMAIVTACVFILGILGRVISQTPKDTAK